MIRATVDIGTNSIRILVAELAMKPPKRLAYELEITGLGRGLDRTGMIREDSLEKTIDALERFVRIARLHTNDLRIFGTAALREARNGPDAARRMERVGGAPVLVIPGSEEARITYEGVALGHALGPDAMVIDIGGGSTEFISRTPDGRIVARSMALGSVRQTERHFTSDPPGEADLAGLRIGIAELVAQGIDGRRASTLYGVAGSVTQIVALELEMDDYEWERVDGFKLTRQVVKKWIERLASMPLDERRKLDGMVPERAPTVIAGAVILDVALEFLGLDRVVVSEYDSLWGALTT